eukprot:451902-Prymnesium_polylepis.1
MSSNDWLQSEGSGRLQIKRARLASASGIEALPRYSARSAWSGSKRCLNIVCQTNSPPRAVPSSTTSELSVACISLDISSSARRFAVRRSLPAHRRRERETARARAGTRAHVSARALTRLRLSAVRESTHQVFINTANEVLVYMSKSHVTTAHPFPARILR